MTSESQSSSPTDQRFFALAVLAGIVKVALAVFIPLSADESYYWVWAKHLDFSYFDHPPMTAWLFAIADLLHFGPMGARVPAVIVGHLTVFVWAYLLKEYLSEKRRLYWLGLFLMCPLTGLGGIIVTPDLPLMLFWSLSLLFLKRILERGNHWDFMGFGIFLGLGFCSKYQIILLPISLLFLVGNKDVREKLFQPKIFLTYLAGLLTCSPVLGWNAHNDWASFKFQLNHGLAGQKFTWHWIGDYVAGELLLLFPTVLWSLRRVKWRGPPFTLALMATGVFPFVFFFLSSFKASSELNWPAMSYPAIFALSAAVIVVWELWTDLLFWLAMEIIVIVSLFVPLGLSVADQLTEPTKYKVLRQLPVDHAPLFASTYQMASSLWYSSGVPVYKLRGMSRADMYDRWDGSLPPHGKFYVLREENTEQYLPKESSIEHWTEKNLESPAPGLELLEVTRP